MRSRCAFPAPRFQDLRRAVSQTLAQRAAGQRRLAAVAQRLQALPAAAVREALGEPGGLTAAAVTQEVDAAVRLPLAIAIYSAPSTPPVLVCHIPLEPYASNSFPTAAFFF